MEKWKEMVSIAEASRWKSSVGFYPSGADNVQRMAVISFVLLREESRDGGLSITCYYLDEANVSIGLVSKAPQDPCTR